VLFVSGLMLYCTGADPELERRGCTLLKKRLKTKKGYMDKIFIYLYFHS